MIAFRAATDAVLHGMDEKDLAALLGCSVALLRQARLGPHAKAHRSPPKEWEIGVAKAAEKKAEQLVRLAAKLRAASDR
ncbi:MAG TPA: hypothetical protein VG387_06265 [Rhizomicrobium sp.]|jgi:hypothetical protein|nr:hypothetical protein [Rhizomicrobium sp.]